METVVESLVMGLSMAVGRVVLISRWVVLLILTGKCHFFQISDRCATSLILLYHMQTIRIGRWRRWWWWKWKTRKQLR